MDSSASPGAIKLSVLVVTYNHRDYIAQALDSILAQQFDQPMEIIVSDDCSTDGTQEIARQYQERNPGRIRLLEPGRNGGITRNYQRGFAACRGEYIAVLEGDDCWLGSDRLSILAGFLDEHPECVMAFNRILLQEMTPPSSRALQWDTTLPYELKSGADLAYQNFIGNFSACMYRAAVVRAQDECLYNQTMYDWLFNLSISRAGLIGYVPRILSVYRQHNSGTWSQMGYEKKLLDTLQLIPTYNEFLQNAFAAQFQAHMLGIRGELKNVRLQRLREKYARNPFVLGYIVAYKLLRRIWRKVRSFAAG